MMNHVTDVVTPEVLVNCATYSTALIVPCIGCWSLLNVVNITKVALNTAKQAFIGSPASQSLISASTSEIDPIALGVRAVAPGWDPHSNCFIIGKESLREVRRLLGLAGDNLILARNSLSIGDPHLAVYLGTYIRAVALGTVAFYWISFYSVFGAAFYANGNLTLFGSAIITPVANHFIGLGMLDPSVSFKFGPVTSLVGVTLRGVAVGSMVLPIIKYNTRWINLSPGPHLDSAKIHINNAGYDLINARGAIRGGGTSPENALNLLSQYLESHDKEIGDSCKDLVK